MNRSRIFFYLLAMLVLVMALRPRQSWENLRQLFVYRRGVVVTLSTILILYLAWGIWQLIQQGAW